MAFDSCCNQVYAQGKHKHKTNTAKNTIKTTIDTYKPPSIACWTSASVQNSRECT